MARATMVRIEAPSRIQLLETSDVIVRQLAEAAGFEDEDRQDIQVAVHESLVNAIVHGNRADEDLTVTVQVTIDRGLFEVRVRDQGWGFDPDAVPDPLAEENLARSSGRGLLLMRTLMDDVEVHRVPGGGTEVTLRKRLPRDSDLRGRQIVARF